MKYLCIFLVVSVVYVQASQKCLLDTPFKDFACKSDTFIQCAKLPMCDCPSQSKCQKSKFAPGSEECEFVCQSAWVEEIKNKERDTYEGGPVKK